MSIARYSDDPISLSTPIKGKKMAKIIGTIHPKNTLFFRIHVGGASDQNNHKYDLSISAELNCPVIASKETGKWFTLSWEDIVTLAAAAGINKSA